MNLQIALVVFSAFLFQIHLYADELKKIENVCLKDITSTQEEICGDCEFEAEVNSYIKCGQHIERVKSLAKQREANFTSTARVKNTSLATELYFEFEKALAQKHNCITKMVNSCFAKNKNKSIMNHEDRESYELPEETGEEFYTN